MSRKVMEIGEVVALESGGIGINRLFEMKNGKLEPTGNRLVNKSKIQMRWRGDDFDFI